MCAERNVGWNEMMFGICFKTIQGEKNERERKRLNKNCKPSVIVGSGLGYGRSIEYSLLL